MIPRPFRPLVASLILALASACSHGSAGWDTVAPPGALARACGWGGAVATARGAVWMKIRSDEVTGQFPATVAAEGPGRLRMEVTNLLGGTEALIEVSGQRYRVRRPSGKAADPDTAPEQSGQSTWGGIPLRWAADLVLGRVPCPSLAARAAARVAWSGEDELGVRVPAREGAPEERFAYRLDRWQGQAWPRALHWERDGDPSLSVDFSFENPEASTGSPLRWEARSRRGEVKLRWKERHTTVGSAEGK